MTASIPPTSEHDSGRLSPAEFRRRAGEAILGGVDKAIAFRWEPAKERARRITGTTVDDKVKALTSTYARELGAIGGATGAAAAAPGIGTVAVIAGSFAEFGYFAVRSSELVLTIGALHGHEDSTIDEQRAWILCVLAFGNGAAEGFTKLAGELGKGLGKKAVARIPTSTLQAINKAAGRTIVTRYGTKRGVVALGRAMPVGIGMAIGGGANYGTTHLLGRHANKFFTELPYATIDTTATSAPRPTL